MPEYRWPLFPAGVKRVCLPASRENWMQKQQSVHNYDSQLKFFCSSYTNNYIYHVFKM